MLNNSRINRDFFVQSYLLFIPSVLTPERIKRLLQLHIVRII